MTKEQEEIASLKALVSELTQRIVDLERELSRYKIPKKNSSNSSIPPSQDIRSIRLKRAAQLLQTGAHTVSEISWMVGVNDIKYFNKYFKEEFGMTPT